MMRTWMIFELVAAGLFGAIVGSFLNACIYRLPREISLIKKSRSFCPQCEAQIAWYDNIPIFSYVVLLGGKCRSCRKPIPASYLLVELMTSAGFLLVIYHCRILNGPYNADTLSALELSVWGWGNVAAYAFLLASLVLITFVDMEHRIIPNEVTFTGIALGPALSVLFPTVQPFRVGWLANAHLDALVASIFGVVLGGGVIWLLGFFGKLAFKKDAMGFGDVKMMAMVGGLMGWPVAVFAVPAAAVVGSVVGIVIVIRTKDHYLPFGPFLALGTMLTMFYGAFAVAYYQKVFAAPFDVPFAYLMPLVRATAY